MRLVTNAAIRGSFIFTVLVVAVLAAAPQKQTFTGTITDSICTNADHSQMHMGPSDEACTLACVDAHGAMFVLYDGKNTTYALSHQKKPREFAGRKVKVVGTLDVSTKTIQVESITDANLDSLIAAYLAVVAIFFAYAFTVARRVARVQADIARLKS